MNLETFIGKKADFSFEHRILNTVLVFGIIISIITIAINCLLSLGPVIIGISITCSVIMGLLYYLSIIKKKYWVAIVFVIFLFILTPVIWFSNGGMLGSTTFYIVMFSSAIAVLLQGFLRKSVLAGLIVLALALIIIEYNYPSLIVVYPSDFTRYADTSLGLLLALLFNTSLLLVILEHYINEHQRANLYLAEMEKQKINSLNERFVRVFNASPSLMAIYREKDLVYVAVNDAWLTCLGLQRDEVIGHSEEELHTLLFDATKRINELVPGQLDEFQVRTKPGKLCDLLVSKAKVQIDGEDCILLASVDRTMQKHLERNLARLDRLNLVGEIAASIGHEIRNPLTTVRGFLQLFQEKAAYSRDKEHLDVMITELDRANSIISEFLALAKDRVIHLKPRNPNSIIQGLYPLLYASAVLEGKEILLELADNLPDIMIDANEIRQLVLNLTQNAKEAMSDGGKVFISTRLESDTLILMVKDTGSGIPPEIYEKLGTPFLTTKETGTGLGLAVCYRIVQRHNAKIEVETSSSGTTFSIKFHVQKPA